ncbi:Maf family protein [Pseudodesulfovibrio senegalensis]|uniref:dTTP/UTP pyrophosphatase n=1 Tax=Pseudodesulfovibrio senegalensis TaxID=1721087 RepID=A0A6N6N7R1_9BACT|nr:Maf family protein [Pseudodesulfovibrio senegalensis]KAB1443708.1 septum formation protein Maf [Pseudodesulfovibrio senegalensis]
MKAYDNSFHGPFASVSSLVLASGSPRRKQLLSEAGLNFTVHASDMDEPQPLLHEKPRDYAERMALLKTRDVAHEYPQSAVIGADTIVVLDEQIMGKPTSQKDALDMLEALSGNTHHVITGCCLMLPTAPSPVLFSAKTDVMMRKSKQEELMAYIASGEPMDKAGAYAIQGIGGFMVREIHGSYSNVVGLPVAEVLDSLLKAGIVQPNMDLPPHTKE